MTASPPNRGDFPPSTALTPAFGAAYIRPFMHHCKKLAAGFVPRIGLSVVFEGLLMMRRAVSRAAMLAGALSWLAAVPVLVRGDEDVRTAPEFVQGLRERGYFDLANDYLERLRQQPDTPADFRATIDYEQGRILLDESSKTGDLVRRKELLELARGKLEAFTKGNPKHELAAEALVQLARLLVERGHLAVLLGEESEDKAEKASKLAEARNSFDQARVAYGAADERLQGEYKTFPPFIPDDDPRKEKRDRTHSAMMDAQLQKAIVDYEQGQTYALASKERTDLMAKALAQFEDLYKRYRTQWSGLTARMWQAKCYEERGDLGPAMGIYNELMDHPDPRLKPLQRHVGYFQIVLLGKRKEYPLAVLGATGWLKAYASAGDHHSKEGLGVRLERAKNLLVQTPEMTNETEKAAYVKQATDDLGEVVRYASPFKSEALSLLKKYKPKAAEKFSEIAKLNYEDAISGADQAIASHEWDRAIALLKQAVRRAETAKDIDKVNLARYTMAFCYYMNKEKAQYYEAAVLTEFLARRYPQGSLSAKASEIGLAALSEAYSTFRDIDRAADLNHMIELATYTAETWPDSEQGDSARMVLGQIHAGSGRYDKAVAAFESVRSNSSKWIEAQSRAGSSHWDQSVSYRRKGKTAEADAEVRKALGVLNAALKTRRDSGAAPSDPALIANVCDIADIHLETGKPAEALALLDPVAKVAIPDGSPIHARLLSDLLRAHVSNNQVDLAIADMNKLEQAGGGTTRTQLYFSLGKLIEKEMDSFKKKGDGAGLNRMKLAYLKFLNALVASKSGQTYESLEWAGENMLTLGNDKQAAEVFDRILKDQALSTGTGANERMLRTRIKLAAALRGLGDYATAETLVDALIKDNPRTIEPKFEKGMILEAKKSWNASFAHWQALALQLNRMRPKPVEYYDAWYHAAVALNKAGKPAEAKQTLGSVMRLSGTVGGPDMKAKYQELLSQIK